VAVLARTTNLWRLWPLVRPTWPDRWRAATHRRLSRVFQEAPRIPIDDHSRLVFFGDHHRGDGSRADAFAANEALFLQVLGNYYDEGFTYVEVGDGDDLWQNRHLDSIRQAHGRTFDLVHRFDREDRLHMIIGNHDILGYRHNWQEKDGLGVEEAVVLEHTPSGQEIFVVHGHQADVTSDRLCFAGRLLVRHVWKRLKLLGLTRARKRRRGYQRATQIERRLASWAAIHGPLVLCGHTHRPAFPVYPAGRYLNVGSCTTPGRITGLELQAGTLALVRWSVESSPDTALHVRREPLGPARELCWFGPRS
jgi:UDP-2,3-diacylglucosamine pyrophosphatase LpxH